MALRRIQGSNNRTASKGFIIADLLTDLADLNITDAGDNFFVLETGQSGIVAQLTDTVFLPIITGRIPSGTAIGGVDGGAPFGLLTWGATAPQAIAVGGTFELLVGSSGFKQSDGTIEASTASNSFTVGASGKGRYPVDFMGRLVGTASKTASLRLVKNFGEGDEELLFQQDIAIDAGALETSFCFGDIVDLNPGDTLLPQVTSTDAADTVAVRYATLRLGQIST